MNGDTIKAVLALPLSTWLLIAISAAVLSGLVILYPEIVPEPYPNTRNWIVLIALITLPIASLWVVWRTLKAALCFVRTPQWIKVRKIRKQYRQLFSQQKELIDRVYKTGRDNFEVSFETYQLRIFKNLVDDGLVEVHTPRVYYANMPINCSITPELSKVLREIHNIA